MQLSVNKGGKGIRVVESVFYEMDRLDSNQKHVKLDLYFYQFFLILRLDGCVKHIFSPDF